MLTNIQLKRKINPNKCSQKRQKHDGEDMKKKEIKMEMKDIRAREKMQR